MKHTFYHKSVLPYRLFTVVAAWVTILPFESVLCDCAPMNNVLEDHKSIDLNTANFFQVEFLNRSEREKWTKMMQTAVLKAPPGTI